MVGLGLVGAMATAPTAALASTQCQPGYYSTTGTTPCTAAPPGSYVDTTGATSATLCPLGTYAPYSAQAECYDAPIGTYVDTTGVIAATACPVGETTATIGSTSSSDCYAPTPATIQACKHGGWTQLVDANGTPFKNQGDCVSYVATGGKNPANG